MLICALAKYTFVSLCTPLIDGNPETICNLCTNHAYYKIDNATRHQMLNCSGYQISQFTIFIKMTER